MFKRRKPHVRPSWDLYFLNMARAASERGECTRTRVGAVLVNGSPPRIVGTGYNGAAPGGLSCLDGVCPRAALDRRVYPPGQPHVPVEGYECIAKHAEMNAVDWAPQPSVAGSTLYITREPCKDCLLASCHRGVASFVWPGGSLWKSS